MSPGKHSTKPRKLSFVLCILLLCPVLFASGINDSGLLTVGFSIGDTMMLDVDLGTTGTSFGGMDVDNHLTLGANISCVAVHDFSSSFGFGAGVSGDFSFIRRDGDWCFGENCVIGPGFYFRLSERFAASVVAGLSFGYASDFLDSCFGLGGGVNASVTYFLSRKFGITAGISSYSNFIVSDNGWDADLGSLYSAYIGVGLRPWNM